MPLPTCPVCDATETSCGGCCSWSCLSELMDARLYDEWAPQTQSHDDDHDHFGYPRIEVPPSPAPAELPADLCDEDVPF